MGWRGHAFCLETFTLCLPEHVSKLGTASDHRPLGTAWNALSVQLSRFTLLNSPFPACWIGIMHHARRGYLMPSKISLVSLSKRCHANEVCYRCHYTSPPSLRHSVMWNKKEWFALAGGVEYAERSFMTHCVRTQTGPCRICSHELHLYRTIWENRKTAPEGAPTGISAPQYSASAGPAWITNSWGCSGMKISLYENTSITNPRVFVVILK